MSRARDDYAAPRGMANEPDWRFGSELRPEVQREALRRFVHRFTRDHVPDWARQPRPNGATYAVQFDSDADWLAHTMFATTNAGKLDNRVKRCESSPTWPDNPELRNCGATKLNQTSIS